jgi:multiple sugar transport system permease protein
VAVEQRHAGQAARASSNQRTPPLSRRLSGGWGAKFNLSTLLERHFGVLVSLPAFFVVAGVTLVPILVGIGYSFTSYSLDRPRAIRFIGLLNYKDIGTDPQVPKVLVTTFSFVAGVVVVETLAGLALALLLARGFRGVGVYRVLYTLPLLVAGIAVATTWRYLLNPSFGWVNFLLGSVGLPQPDWTASSITALPSIILADSWSGVPLMALLILAGLLAVPQHLVEAAKIDGANGRQIFRYAVLPSIAPVLTIGVLFQIVNAFRRFELIQVMTGGGPGISSMVLNYYIYQTGFAASQIGYASALAVLLLACMIASLLVVFTIARRRR